MRHNYFDVHLQALNISKQVTGSLHLNEVRSFLFEKLGSVNRRTSNQTPQSEFTITKFNSDKTHYDSASIQWSGKDSTSGRGSGPFNI